MDFMTWSQERHKNAKNMHLYKSVHISSASNSYLKKKKTMTPFTSNLVYVFFGNNINVTLSVREAECFESC